MASTNLPANSKAAQQRIRSGFMRLRGVQEQTGLTRSAVYRLIREGRFPRPIRLGSLRCVGWLRFDVNLWVERQIAQNQSLKKDRPEASNKAVA
jgi:prophage regulatory protein